MRREWWLDIATAYGDPMDFISEGRPHSSPEATNIHVIEKLPGDVVLTRAEAEELKRVLIEGDHIDDVLDVLNRAMTEAEPEFPEKEFQDFIESAAARDSEGDYRLKTIAKWAWDRRGKAGT